MPARCIPVGALALALFAVVDAGAQTPVPEPVSETYNNGDRFVGKRVLGQREGAGVYYYANGDRYEGEYRNGRATGVGVYYAADGSRYEGEFVDGRFEGYGTLTLPDGTRHSGLWKNNELVR